jgi:hypothetical protein
MKQNTRKFSVQVWFKGFPNSYLLSTVTVYAGTEDEAVALVENSLDYKVSGVDGLTWQVHEKNAEYVCI